MNFKIEEFYNKLDPFEVYSIFKDEENTIFLDSSKEDKKLSKYSFIGLNPFIIFESYGKEIYINNERVKGDNPFLELEKLINKYKFSFSSNIPLISGCMGYFSYDAGRIIEDIPNISKEDIEIPDMRFIFYDNIIIFDLLEKKSYITALGVKEDSNMSIARILNRVLKENPVEKKIDLYRGNTEFFSNFTKDEYKKQVEKLKDYIVKGDVYIANMTQRFYCKSNRKSFDIYSNLREINKAPFSAYINFKDFQVISSSPERFIQIKNNKVHTRPIKGTRPRGKNKEDDERNKELLLNSEKDKAELLMVVDLERNDLSKVCKPHSVKVTELFALEEYATVFHLVSTVEGELKENVSAVECMKACFPGGSITGTPKIRAMEIIEELEGLKRNLYTGSIGYFDFRGNSDFNIVIRTIVKKNNKCYFGVGGGITFDSIEEDEYNETLDKAKALMRVL